MTFWERLEEAKKKAREEDSRPGLNADNRPTRNLSNELQQTATQTRPTIVLPTAAQTIQNGALNNMNTILSSSKRNAPNTRTIDDLRVEMEEARQIANEMSRMESDGMRDFQALQTPGSERYKQYRNAGEARRAYENARNAYDQALISSQNNRVNAAQNAVTASGDYTSAIRNGASASIPNKYKNLKDVVSYITDWEDYDFNDWRDRVEFGMDHGQNFRQGAYNVDMMTQQEKDTVLYYVGKGEYEKASDYLDDLERTLNQRANSGVQEQTAQQAESHPILGAIAGIASWPLNIPAALDTVAQAIRQGVTGEYMPADPNRDSYALSKAASGFTQGVSEAAGKGATELTGSERAGNIARFLAGAGLSIGQNVTQIASLGPAALPAMALSASGQGATSAVERGGSYGQAALVGVANGVVEALTEKIPLDNLFRMASAGRQTASETVKSILRQMGTEATEESISEIANNIVDTAVMGDKSEYRQYVSQLVQSGVPQAEAEKQAFVQFFILNTTQAAAGGALSGGLMGGGASAINTIRNRVTLPTAGQNGVLPTANQTTVDTTQPTVESTRPTVETAQPTVERDNVMSTTRDQIRSDLSTRKDFRQYTDQAMQNNSQEALGEMFQSGEVGVDAGNNLFLRDPEDHIDQRSMGYVGSRKVNAFQFDNPALHGFFADAAQELINDVVNTTPGERWSYEAMAPDGTHYTQWNGTKRATTSQIAELLDDQHMSYDQIMDAAQKIINDQGQENYAHAKRVELILDDMLTNGWRDMTGYYHEPNQDYIRMKREIPGAYIPEETADYDRLADIDPLPENENTASTGETVSLVDRIRQSIPQIENMQSVATVTGNEIPTGGKLVDRLVSFINSIGNRVNRPGFGDVLFSKGRIKNSMIGHGVGNTKIETFAAVPDVIQNGVQIDYQPNWKGRSYDTYTFAAPVDYRGNKTYLGVVVTKDAQDGRYYVHEVVDSNGNTIYRNNENTEPTSDGPSALSGDLDTVVSSVSNNSVAQTGQNVNTNNGVMGRPVSGESTVGAAESGFDPYSHMLNEYGAIPEGENPARVIDVPVSTDGNDRVSRAARTVMEAEATPDNMLGEIADAIAKGELSHDVLGDEKAMTRARNTVEREGFTNALTKFKTNVSKGIVSKDNVALGQVLLNNAMNAGDSKTAIDILTDYAAMATSAGQALQAQRIFKKLSPEGQLYGIQRTASHIQEEIQKRFKDREITIDPELEAEFLAQTDQEGRDKVMEKIYQNVADQIPSNWRDKWNAWRYMAMLVNPRTHIRNVAGNLLFQPVRMVKDKVAATMETFVHAINPNFEKTKSFVANPDLYRAAWSDFKNVKDILSGNKYDDIRSEINSRRTVFGGVLGKPFEAVRTGNSWALEAEDVIFKRLTYADALSGYLQSRGVTGEQLRSGNVDSNLLSAARDYAGQEALKATYQDKNQFSDLLSRRFQENNTAGKVANAAIDAVLPFRRTPANILVRGFEYSPLGLAKSITADLVQVGRGNMSGAQAIDNIAAGLTGSGLFALGAYLLAQGIVTSGGDESEEQNDLNDLTGKQNYALNLPGGGSVTLDWLAPESLPFFMGVEFMDALGEGGSVMETITSALTSISEPMLELSMLQSLNDLIDSVSFAESSGKLVSMAGSALISYLTQAIPTLGGQIERTTEENRMSSFTDRNNPLSRDIQYALSRASARLPGDFQQVPYIDAWGRTESNGNPLTRALNNFLNPAYTSQINETAADREIQRLLDAGMTGVVPDRTTQSQKVDGAYLSPEQYVEYATIKGQTSYDVVSEMIESELYQNMTDEEKADAIKRAYQYAGHVAAQAINPEHESESYVEGAQNAQDDFGLSEAEYLLMDRVYGKSGMERIKETMDSGVSMDTAIKVNNALDALKPKRGEDSVSNLQRYRAVVDNVSSVNQQLSVLKTVSTDSDYRKFVVGNNFGVSPSSYVTAREAMSRFDQPNSSGNLGTYTQAEIEAMLDSFPSSATLTGSGTMTLTNSQKAVLWQLISGSSSPKNNPYSYSIGQQVIDAVNEAKQSNNQGTTQTNQYSGLLNFLPGG